MKCLNILILICAVMIICTANPPKSDKSVVDSTDNKEMTESDHQNVENKVLKFQVEKTMFQFKTLFRWALDYNQQYY